MPNAENPDSPHNSYDEWLKATLAPDPAHQPYFTMTGQTNRSGTPTPYEAWLREVLQVDQIRANQAQFGLTGRPRK